ncbi:MAG TPA: hypothetical protein VLH16_03010, partial [Bacteroidales bacterium]|nr:hypothetical protein [Bacteroidales bacterium]
YYPVTIRKDYMLIDQTCANAINKQENLRCTPRFYAILFSFLHQESYHFFQAHDRKSKNYYLVNRKLASTFDFEEFLYQLRSISSKKIKASYTIKLAKFISTFYRPGRFEAPERIHSICAEIAYEEFGYATNSNGITTINRNTSKRSSDHLTELLRETGRPMTLREIAHTLRERNIKTPANLEALRSSLILAENIVPIGKTSTYSLREWKNIKTGTIRKLAVEFLEKRTLPAHISEIASYIMPHRNTKPQLIFYNLKIESHGIFKFFPNRYIGLSNKDYPPQWTTNPQLSLL